MITAEQREIRDLAHEFAERELRPRSAAWDQARALDDDVFSKLAEVGFLGMTVPEAHGGLGLDAITYLLVLEELAWGDAAVALSVARPQRARGRVDRAPRQRGAEGGVPAAARRGGAARRVRALRAAGRQRRRRGRDDRHTGGRRVAVARRQALSDQRGARGTGGRIRPHRGGQAGGVPGRPSGRGVDGGPPGGHHGSRGLADGVGGARLERAEHPGARRSGGRVRPGHGGARPRAARGRRAGGRDRARGARARDRLRRAARAVRPADRAFRRGAGEAGRDGPAGGGRARSRSRGRGPRGRRGARARWSPWAAMAKVTASEAALWVADDAVQVFGGYGYMRDYPVEKLMRDAKGTEIYEGTSEILLVVIARELLR
ncbi:MAG: hypothetical protein EXR95_10445 [Gemmatimonadetes bacterium]|nr:hypothetical protein [Gemmatimonadota bacterium]